jgi:hypothetical protein
MLDPLARAALQPAARWGAGRLAALGVSADALTLSGFVVGIGAAVAAGRGLWIVALVLWLVNRGLDGLDGAVARLAEPTDRGAFLDIAADFTVYGAFVVGPGCTPRMRRPAGRVLRQWLGLPRVLLACRAPRPRHR